MGLMTRCDLTGTTEDGAGVGQVFVPIGKKVRLAVSIQVAKDEKGKRWGSGKFTAAGAAKLTDAIKTLKLRPRGGSS